METEIKRERMREIERASARKKESESKRWKERERERVKERKRERERKRARERESARKRKQERERELSTAPALSLWLVIHESEVTGHRALSSASQQIRTTVFVLSVGNLPARPDGS